MYKSSLMVETVAPVSKSAVQVLLHVLITRVIPFGVPTDCFLLTSRPCAEPDPWPKEYHYGSFLITSHSKYGPSYQAFFAIEAYYQYSLGKQAWNQLDDSIVYGMLTFNYIPGMTVYCFSL